MFCLIGLEASVGQLVDHWTLVVWVRAPPEEKTLLLLLSNGFTSKSDNGALVVRIQLQVHTVLYTPVSEEF